ncbi:MAG: SDR family oxidoreductase [Planctomycetota bacterium]
MSRPIATNEPAGYAIVTGGGSGIGRALCERLAGGGWAVAVADIDSEAAQATADSLRRLPNAQAAAAPVTATPVAATPVAVALDVGDPVQWRRLIANLQARWPRLDLLINNAGVLAGGPLADCPAESLQRVVRTNLLGAMYGARAAAAWLMESSAARGANPGPAGGPRPGVINVASIFAAVAPPNFAAYSASKAGLVAFSESLRGELAPNGLNVTVGLPGAVDTGLYRHAEFAHAGIARAAARFVERAELTPQAVADGLLRAAGRGELYAVLGRRARWYARLKRWLPAATARRVAAQARREIDAPEA